MEKHRYPPHIVSAVKEIVQQISAKLGLKIKQVGGVYKDFTDFDSLVDELVYSALISVAWTQTVGLNDIDGLAEGTVLQEGFGRSIEVNESNKKAIKDVFSVPYRVIYWPTENHFVMSDEVLRKLEWFIKSSPFGGLIIQRYLSHVGKLRAGELRNFDGAVTRLAKGIARTVLVQSIVHDVEHVKELPVSAILFSDDGVARYQYNFVALPREGDYPARVLHWG